MDAADVDLKAFTEDFYARICGGSLKPVLNSLTVLKEEGVWLEITNLVIPTLNDDMKNIREMSRWIVRNLGRMCLCISPGSPPTINWLTSRLPL